VKKAWLLSAALFAFCCARQTPDSLTGKVLDAGTGEGIPEALVSVGARAARTVADGSYSVDSVCAGDTVRVSCGGYATLRTVLETEKGEFSPYLRNFELRKNRDTAFTAGGPVDASIFLEDGSLKPKKLSPNEARIIVLRAFPGVRVSRGSLLKVNESEEWVFDLRIGRAYATVFLDAHSGEIRSVESDDPNVDRRLQEMLRK